MKGKRGSALVLVMCIMSALSILILKMYQRSALLLQTVAAYESDIKMRYACHALMLYAVHMAKHNWAFLVRHAQDQSLLEHRFMWEVDRSKCDALCIYTVVSKERLAVRVSLEPNHTRSTTILCELIIQPNRQVMIADWQEK